MSYAVCIVTHNSSQELSRLLNSIDEHLPVRPQIICADNGSTDDSASLARDHGAEVILMEGNPGFGAANNAALKLVTEPVTLLLNPDCCLINSDLVRLTTAAATRRALLAPRLLNEDGTTQDSAHPLPGGRDGYLAALTVPRLLPSDLRNRVQPFRAQRELEVGWAIAACIAAQTDLLKQLGPFDGEDFLFAEDLDLCLRARSLGVPTIFDPSVAVTHSGGHATDRMDDPARAALQARRRRAVIGRELGAGALERDDRSQALTFKLRALVGRDRRRNEQRLEALRQAQNKSN